MDVTRPGDTPAGSSLNSAVRRRTLLANGARTAAAFGLTGGIAALAAACQPGSKDSGGDTIRPGGTLHAGVSSDPDTLDPQKSSLAVSAEIYAGVFDRLVDLEPNGEIKPSLAAEWSTPNDTTYVFTLRPDVAFHNGKPLTPEDVAFTFRRIIDENLGSPYAGDFAALQGVEVTGPRQVTFHLKHPFAPMMANLANRGHILSKSALETDDPARRPIGTGPFAFDVWNQGQNLNLKKNPKYHVPDRPYLDAVNFRYLPVDQGRVLALQTNQLGWVDGIAPQNVAAVKADNQLRHVSSTITGRPEFLLFNTTRTPLNNRALRQAICWAADRKQIAEVGFLGAAEPGSIEFGRGSSWYTDSDPYAKGPDPSAVRSKLAEAGFPRGGVTIKFLAWTSGPDAERTGQLLQQQLKPFNINIEIETVEISVWLKRIFAKDYDLTLAFQEQLVDPDNYWSLFYLTDAPQNFAGYANPAVDALVQQATKATDAATRRGLYGQIRSRVLDDAAVFFTAYIPLDYATRRNVIGAAITPIQDPRFVNIGLS